MKSGWDAGVQWLPLQHLPGRGCRHVTACCAGGIHQEQVEYRRAVLLAHFGESFDPKQILGFLCVLRACSGSAKDVLGIAIDR